MTVTFYFIGDEEEKRTARAVPAAFVNRCGNYDPLETAVVGRNAFVAVRDPLLFGRVDSYMCRHDLYDRGNVTILNEDDCISIDEFPDPVVFLTDDLKLARSLKRLEASR